MGVPAFFRWLSKKYPSIVVQFDDQQDRGEEYYHFDNLYLDMNGIIHPCTHPEYKAPPETEEDMFEAIFEYIEKLMKIIKPKKLLYMAVDGVAPRAKMNQQRSRRFRASKESGEKKIEVEKIKNDLRERGIIVEEREDKKHFDSNVITPGTDFMMNLSKALRGWLDMKLSDLNIDEDEIWPKDLVVILSDASVPGEGEHKIIDYIRKQRAMKDYNPNLSHCLCGADADLIMLALATHELDFTILREEFLPNQPRPCEICGQLGHEMADCEGTARVENEFPVLPTEPGFIFIRINVLREYLAKEAAQDYELERFIDDFVFMCFFVGNDFLPHLPSLEIREGAIDRLMGIYKDVMSSHKGQYLTHNGFVNLKLVQTILHQLGLVEDEIFKRRQVDQKRFRQRRKQQQQQKNQYKAAQNLPWMRPEAILPRGERPDAFHNAREEASKLRQHTITANQSAAAQLKAMLRNPGEDTPNASVKRKLDDVQETAASDSEPDDDVNLGTEGWKERYYYLKFDATDYCSISRLVAKEYVIGLCWVLRYYYQGCPDWKWFYPFHYAPFASDFVNVENIKVEFDSNAQPFKPLEQLMSVFPAASAGCLPPSWRKLMMDTHSPIIDFYPVNFKVDLNGKHAAWMGVALLPFIDEERMFTTLESVYPDLSKSEKKRNSLGCHLLFLSRKKEDATHFVDDLIGNNCSEKVEIDHSKFDGMFGEIRINKKFTKQYQGCVCVEFYDPEYTANYVFPAVRLEGAVTLMPVLKPEEQAKGFWRPMIGMQRSNKVASIDPAGKRMMNHANSQAHGNRFDGQPNAYSQQRRFPNNYSPFAGQSGGGGHHRPPSQQHYSSGAQPSFQQPHQQYHPLNRFRPEPQVHNDGLQGNHGPHNVNNHHKRQRYA